ncbi:MAG: NUDIX hydrolase [Candidatus Micrarchaeia archaeon]
MKKVFYKNDFLEFAVENKKVKNKMVEIAEVIENDAVVILPILNNKIIMEWQYRPALGKYIYEIPAGHIKNGENKKYAVIRELEEETGYIAKRINKLLTFYSMPGISKMKTYVYIAKDLVKGKQNLDQDEIINIKFVTINKALQMIKSGNIKDEKTIIAILFYLKFFIKE